MPAREVASAVELDPSRPIPIPIPAAGDVSPSGVSVERPCSTLFVSTTFPVSARPGAAPIGATMAAMASAPAAAGAKARRITEYLFLQPHPPIQSQAARARPCEALVPRHRRQRVPDGPARPLVVGPSVCRTSGADFGREGPRSGCRPAPGARSPALPGPPASAPLLCARPAGGRGGPGHGHQRGRRQIPTSPCDQAPASRSPHHACDPMSQDHVAVEIRDAFDSSYVARPGLEDRVISAIPWERPSESASSMPRLAVPAAAATALLAVGALLPPTLLRGLHLQFPALTPPATPACSPAAARPDP